MKKLNKAYFLRTEPLIFSINRKFIYSSVEKFVLPILFRCKLCLRVTTLEFFAVEKRKKEGNEDGKNSHANTSKNSMCV